MTPGQVRGMRSAEIVELLMTATPAEEVLVLLAAVITDDNAFEGVKELHRRYSQTTEPSPVKTSAGRHPHAMTVAIDAEKWKTFFWRRRMTLTEVGPSMIPPRSSAWASCMANRGRAGYWALDDLATALGLHVSDLILQVGTDDEVARLCLSV